MFSRIRNFIYRHRKKFIVSGIIVGGGIILTRYAQKKFIEWQDSETKEFLKRTRKQYLYENTERTCNQTIISLAAQLKAAVYKCLDTEHLLEKLRSHSQGNDKLSTWKELMIISFARHSALLYCGLMLSVLLRIQVNVVGGQLTADCPEEGPAQERYLALCRHFIETGVKDVCHLIEHHVRNVLGSSSLKENLNLRDLEHLFWSIQATIGEDDADPLASLPGYLLPPGREDDPVLRPAVDKTVTLLQSDRVHSLCQAAAGRAYADSVDRLAEFFVPENNNAPEEEEDEDDGARDLIVNGPRHTAKFAHPNTVSMPMAKVIPIIHGLFRNSDVDGRPDPWIYQFVIMDSLKQLGADVFHDFAE